MKVRNSFSAQKCRIGPKMDNSKFSTFSCVTLLYRFWLQKLCEWIGIVFCLSCRAGPYSVAPKPEISAVAPGKILKFDPGRQAGRTKFVYLNGRSTTIIAISLSLVFALYRLENTKKYYRGPH